MTELWTLTSGKLYLAATLSVQTKSDANCRFGREWGYDANGIWVREGCRAEFAVRGPMQARVLIRTTVPVAVAERIPGTLRCESENMGRKHCDTDTRYGITLVRQLSDAPCILNSTWGYDTDGIWVTAGCRAEFVLRR